MNGLGFLAIVCAVVVGVCIILMEYAPAPKQDIAMNFMVAFLAVAAVLWVFGFTGKGRTFGLLILGCIIGGAWLLVVLTKHFHDRALSRRR